MKRKRAGSGAAGPAAAKKRPDAAAPAGTRLAWLLGDQARRFFADVWEQRPLHVARADAAFYGDAASFAGAIFCFIARHDDPFEKC